MPESFAEDVAAITRIEIVQKILEVICRSTGMGVSAIARVTEDRWIACAVHDEIAFGLKPGGELDIRTTICAEIRASGHLVAIDHVAADAVFCNHHTPKRYGFQSYISVPIKRTNGHLFGTLCAINPTPAKVNNATTIGMFTLFAELIAQHLETQEKLVASESALQTERDTAQFREQFMAVLGHDLRNPLSAIASGAEVIRLLSTDEELLAMVNVIQRSTKRMAGLIDNVLDFARGRLGGGIAIHRAPNADVAGAIDHVIAELQTAWPHRRLHNDVRLTNPVTCDAPRIGQMLSNLLANALAHGDPKEPVWVRGHTDAPCRSVTPHNGTNRMTMIDDCFELSVTNRGPTIPPDVRSHLFKPFVRGAGRTEQQGLGLGLYIAAEIARAHHGTLGVTSDAGETTFTFSMPLAID
jgi:signal transduction histidine kinase